MYYHARLPLSLVCECVCVWSALLLHNIYRAVLGLAADEEKKKASPAQYHLAKYSSWDVYDHITPRSNNKVVNKHSSLFLIYIYHLQYFLHAAAFTWALPFLFLLQETEVLWRLLETWVTFLTAATHTCHRGAYRNLPRPFAPRSPRKSEGQHLMWEGRELMAYLESVSQNKSKTHLGTFGSF